MPSKIILVIGEHRAEPSTSLTPCSSLSAGGYLSPYEVFVLTRDTNSPVPRNSLRKELRWSKVCTLAFPTTHGPLQEAWTTSRVYWLPLEGAYDVYVNTDSVTLGEAKEIFIGMRIFVLAKQVGTVQHYVWSGLGYTYEKAEYNPSYRSSHRDDRGRRPREPLDAVPQSATLYIDMLCMVSGHRANRWAPRDRGSSWPYLVSTFTKVTGKPAVYVPLSIDEWVDLRDKAVPSRRTGAIASRRELRIGDSSSADAGHWLHWRAGRGAHQESAGGRDASAGSRPRIAVVTLEHPYQRSTGGA